MFPSEKFISWNSNNIEMNKLSMNLLGLFWLAGLHILIQILGFPVGSVGKEPACNAGDTGDVCLIPELGRFPGGGYGNPLQCSCLENPMDRGAWWSTVHRSQRAAHDWSDWAYVNTKNNDFILTTLLEIWEI